MFYCTTYVLTHGIIVKFCQKEVHIYGEKRNFG